MNRGRRVWAARAALLAAMAMHGYGQAQHAPIPKGTNTQTPGGLKTQNPKPARADSTAEFLGAWARLRTRRLPRAAPNYSQPIARFVMARRRLAAKAPTWFVRPWCSTMKRLTDRSRGIMGVPIRECRVPSFTEAQLYDIAEFLHMRIYAANRGTYKVQNVVTEIRRPAKRISTAQAGAKCATRLLAIWRTSRPSTSPPICRPPFCIRHP